MVELRSLEWPPEQVIKTVKQIAREVGFTGTSSHEIPPLGWNETDRFLSDLVNWSIAEYCRS